jgi:transcriptional regulator with XRE-family HTH domain
VTESFGARLRRERERQHISIKSIAAATNIRAAFFEQLERGDASKWPSGIFRRSFIRAYASAVGLDPDATVREFLEAFPDPAQPSEPETKTANAPSRSAVRPTELRLQLAVGGVGPQRCLATCFDAAGLAAMAVAAFILFGQVWMPLGIAMLAYYLGGTILTGATPGVFFLDWCRRRGRTAKPARVPSASPFLVHPERGHSLSLELSTHSGVVSNQ